MNRLLAAVALGTFSALAAPAFAGDGWHADFDEAAALAKKEGKDLFVDFTGSDWCGWCIRLHNEVFEHSEWSDAVKQDYVLVALDFPRGEEAKAKVPNPERNQELMDKYGVAGFPTILMMTPDGDVFGQSGYREGGPTAYLEHMAELRKVGKAQLVQVMEMVNGALAAEGEARPVALAKCVAFLKDNGPDVAGKTHLVKAARAALALEGDEHAALRIDAVEALMAAGAFDKEIFETAIALDPKNETGMYERAVEALCEGVASEDDVKAALPAIEAFSKLGKHHDDDRAAYIFLLGAYWNDKVMSDLATAKRFAKMGIDIGHSNDRINSALEEILNR